MAVTVFDAIPVATAFAIAAIGLALLGIILADRDGHGRP